MTDLTDALNLIKRFESCKFTAYQDVVGVWTLGWGHTMNVNQGDTCTQAEADEWLNEDVTQVAKQVETALDVDLNDNQFNALVSFTYNVGIGRLQGSTLLKRLNAGQDPSDVSSEFLRWDYAGGRVVPGLELRREAERNLFLS